MKVKELVREICLREGLKKSVDIAQVTEIVGHLADVMEEELSSSENPTTLSNLLALAEKRAKKKKAKKK